jgi:hypothetical protein
MTRDFEPDPEVLADLALRRASEHDRTRSRGDGIYDWEPSKPVGFWACRNPQCKGMADVYEENVTAFGIFNREIVKRGEKPLEDHRIMFCDRCLAEYRRTAPDRRRAQVERMAVAIRSLKESGDATRERDLIAQISEWGHPDVEGLVNAIAERRAAESGRSSKKRQI